MRWSLSHRSRECWFARASRFFGIGLLGCGLVCLGLPALARGAEGADDEASAPPSWSFPSPTVVRGEVFHWLESRNVEPAKRDEIAKTIWPEPAAPAAASNPPAPAAQITPDELLDRVVRTIAAVDPPAKELLDLCAKPHQPGPLPKFPWLTDDKTPPLVRNNLRLWYGRWLAQQRQFDESLEQLKGLAPTDVVDPASLLFYQAADYPWLLDKTPGLATLNRLLERRKEIPRRYVEMAGLMQADLAGLKDDSLDHISRRMREVENWLDRARAGKKVRGTEDGIIASLDKLIEDMEKQQSQQGGGGQMGSGGIRSSSPAPDSGILTGKGPGEVQRRDIGHQSGWGDLPPKQRDEALQAIGKEFPSHFRDAIEQYFKRLATDDTDQP